MSAPSLVEFLTARLDEDEAVARPAASNGLWGRIPLKVDSAVRVSDGAGIALTGWDSRFLESRAPARVLADVAAKRRIVREYAGEIERGPAGERDDFVARHGGIVDAYRVAVQALASVYADHPDYDESWAGR